LKPTTNLLPNLEAFLSEMRKQPQVAEPKEKSGSLIINLKEPLSENDPFIQQVEGLAKKLGLEPYITTSTRKAETNRDPIQAFIEKIKPFCVGEPNVTEKETIVFLKPEIVNDYETFRELRLEALKVGAALIAYPHPGFSVPRNAAKAKEVLNAVESFKVNVAALHACRLKEYYHPDISAADATESTKYLLDLGWTENEFDDLGVSRPTFYRLKKSLSRD
jgi:hypothetical protein